ncbi:hypothetical protein [Hymenobacter jeollabukensis]
MCRGQVNIAALDSVLKHPHNRWSTIGLNYDVVNQFGGVSLSNGLDEEPVMHFEDLPASILYKIQGMTDFKNSYSFDGKLAYTSLRWVSLASIEYSQLSFSGNRLLYRNANLSAERGLGFINCGVVTKIGWQELNNAKGFGAKIGLQKSYTRNFDKKSLSAMYLGVDFGYYFHYTTYSVYTQGFILRNTSLRLNYGRIDYFNFFSIGLQYTFNR